MAMQPFTYPGKSPLAHKESLVAHDTALNVFRVEAEDGTVFYLTGALVERLAKADRKVQLVKK